MEIRLANIKDIPNIIPVLKSSLGEANLPISEKIWNYKHRNSPFGESLVLIATKDEEILGVRAFMKWQWQQGEKTFLAYRAVDTATHPDHQGKGIFKKLTLAAVELGIENKSDFIFNTPNKKSRPGYIKMGWTPVGKIKVCLKPLIYFKKNIQQLKYEVEIPTSETVLDNLCLNWNNHYVKYNILFSPKSSSYLKWRYEENPLQRYEIYCKENFYLAMYVKERGDLKEFRVSECIFNQGFEEEVKAVIISKAKKFGCHFISISSQIQSPKMSYFSGKIGPILTFRNLSLSDQRNNHLLDLEKWGYSLGDLELF